MAADPRDATHARGALDRFQRDFERLRAAVTGVVRGLVDVVDRALLSAIAGGHVLLEGNPGLGKTLLARSMATAFGLSFRRIQLTPDLLPADIVGTEVLRTDPSTGSRDLRFRPGPLHAHVVRADEVNRATSRTQSALLEGMAEGPVTVGAATHRLPDRFFLVATQNPVELEGTFPLPEAQLDRFAVRLLLPYPGPETLDEVIRGGLRGRCDSAGVEPALLAPGERPLWEALLAARASGDEEGALHAERALSAATSPRLRALAAVTRGAVETAAAVRTITRLLLALQPAAAAAHRALRRARLQAVAAACRVLGLARALLATGGPDPAASLLSAVGSLARAGLLEPGGR